MISRRLLLGMIASVPAVKVFPVAATPAPPDLKTQYFAACIKRGLMTASEVQSQINRKGGPDWSSLPVSVRL